jgi:hypothetical protein
MLFPVRLFALLMLFAASVSASADWLIFIPSGRKLPYQTGKAELSWAAATTREVRTTMGYGLTPTIEFDFTSETLDPRNTLLSCGVSYNVTDPVVNFVPGLQIGVVDIANKTADGRRFYVATSYDVGMTGEFNGDTPMKLTLGVVGGSMNGPFVGVTVPFTRSFIGLAEHDSRRLSAGFEFKPTRDTSLKWIFRENQVLWAAGFTLRL